MAVEAVVVENKISPIVTVPPVWFDALHAGNNRLVPMYGRYWEPNTGA